MKSTLYLAIPVFCSALALLACQTTAQNPLISDNTNVARPTLLIASDSDGDDVSDELDQCPGTPLNAIVDDRGCPFTAPGLGLKMEYRAFFDKDSSELPPKYQAELDNVGIKMQEYKTSIILIEGHNSRTEVDNASINKPNALAQDRANKVKDYLITTYNIDPERITAVEYGARRPIAPSDSEEGNMLNRRVYAIAIEPQE